MSNGFDEARKLAVASTQKRAERRLFIKGPIYLDWISCAAQLPGKALAVGLAIWWRRNLTGDPVVKLTSEHCRRFGVATRNGRSAALRALEQAGLVEVDRMPNRAPRVTLVLRDRAGPS